MRKTTNMREAQTKNRTMDRPALHTPALPCNDCMRACACCCARMRALGPCASMCLHAHGSTCVCELVGMCKDSQTHLCMCADSSAFLCMCACMRATPCVCESMRNKHCGTCVWTARDGAMFSSQTPQNEFCVGVNVCNPRFPYGSLIKSPLFARRCGRLAHHAVINESRLVQLQQDDVL